MNPNQPIEPLEQSLKRLKAIEPSLAFRENSRQLILGTPKIDFHPKIFRHILSTAQFGAAFGLTAIFIFLILGGLSALNQKLLPSALLSNLDAENLKKEMQGFEIQIQLSEAKYYQDSAGKIEIALKETSGELKNSENRNEKLDELLKELIL
jgi:hypothetical protein